MSRNKTELIGNIGTISEMKFINSDKQISISVCTTETYKKKDSEDWVNIPTWHYITFWNKQAEYIQRNAKIGRLIFLTLQLSYFQKSINEKNYTFHNFKVKNIDFLTAQKNNTNV